LIFTTSFKKKTTSQLSIIALGNGSSLPTTCGNNNISVGDSSEGGVVLVRFLGANSNINMNASTYNPVIIPSEIIGNNTFSNWVGSLQNIWTTQPNPNISLSFTRKRVRSDCNIDGGIDNIITIWDLPFTQTDGSSIPNGTKLRFISPSLTNLATGSTLLASADLWFEWQNTNWLQLTAAPNGVILPIIEDWGTF
jgi:hypothetical protein